MHSMWKSPWPEPVMSVVATQAAANARANGGEASHSPLAASMSEGGKARKCRDGLRRLAVQMVCAAVAIGAWQFAVTTGLLASSAIAPPSAIARSLWPLLSTADFWSSVWATLRAWSIGLVISVGIAVPAGLVLGASDQVYRMSRFAIDFLRTIPPVALIPLALLLYGATQTMSLVLIVFGSAWPVLLQSMYGVHQVDPVAREVARAYRLSRRNTILNVVLPSAAPSIAIGIRIAATMSLLLAIGAELIGGAPGVGNSIALAEANGDTARMYAFVVVSATLGVLLNMAMLGVEGRALAWHPSHRPHAAA
jgi:ABC-type nitrate/sulfonate/bicarbonate transport system permease component